MEVVIYRWIADICRREIQRFSSASHMAGLRAGTEYRWASAIMIDLGRNKPMPPSARARAVCAHYGDWMRRGLDRPYMAARGVVERAIQRIEASIKVEVACN